MYTDKFDNLIDEVLEITKTEIFSKKKVDFSEIYKSENITKYQKEINSILVRSIEMVEKIKSIEMFGKVGKPLVIDIFKKYISAYFFLLTGLYQKSIPNYVNKFIDFIKLQNSYEFKSPEFFNSEGTNFIIESLRFLEIVKISKTKTFTTKDDEIKKALNFSKNINCKNDDEYNKCLAKEAILKFLYHSSGKNQLIELVDNGDDEYVYIDVVVPKDDSIDISSLMNSLPEKVRNIENAQILYDLLNEESEVEELLTYDEKILRLINSKAIIPIAQDFMLFNKPSEKYVVNATNKKDTKIKYITEKINNAKNYFSENVDEKKKQKRNFH